MEEDLLRAASLKNTKKRRLILALLERAPLPLTAEELYEQARQATPISLSTVYRILGVCSEHGLTLRSNSPCSLTLQRARAVAAQCQR